MSNFQTATHESVRRIHMAVLIFTVGLLYFQTFFNGFIWDDEQLIVNNPFIRTLDNVVHFFTPEYWRREHPIQTPGLYRPIRNISFALDHAFWGNNPGGYHFTNMMMHMLNVLLVYLLFGLIQPQGNFRKKTTGVSMVGDGATLPFIAALLFAVYPGVTESVNWIKNRSELLAALFMLVSFVLFLKYRSASSIPGRRALYTASLLCYATALTCKETAATLPALIFFYMISFRETKTASAALIVLLPFMAVLCAFAGLICFLFHTSPPAPGASGLNIPAHIVLILNTIAVYLKILIHPWELNADRTLMGAGISLNYMLHPNVIFLAILALSATIAFRYSKKCFFGLSWCITAILPAANIFVSWGRPLAEQRLYIPAIGFCFFIGAMIHHGIRLRHRSPFLNASIRSVAVLIAVAMVLSFAVRTYSRNGEWRTPYAFWLSALEADPGNIRAYDNFIKACERLPLIHEQIKGFHRAIEIQPAFPQAYYFLGNLKTATGDLAAARTFLDKALSIDPGRPRTLNSLGVVLQRTGEWTGAIGYFMQSIERDSYFGAPYQNLALIYLEQKRYDLAIEYVDKALSLGLSIDADLLKKIDVLRKPAGVQQ